MKNSEHVRLLQASYQLSWRSAGILVIFLALVLGGVYILPRALVGIELGLVLAVSGLIFQAIIRHPLATVGLFLAYIPVDFLFVALLRFLGVPHVTVLSVCLDGALLLAALALWLKNGIRPIPADWFLFTFFALAFVYLCFGGTAIEYKGELIWVLAYVAGRVAVLDPAQARLWARRAIWICGILSIAGAFEVFVLGPVPRTLLYTALTDESALGTSAFAQGYRWMRECSTMAGPLDFAGLSMICVILWWVYSRRPIPGALVAAGLVLTVTRSAWAGALLAVMVLAVRLEKKRALFFSACVAGIAIFAVASAIGLDAAYLHPEKDPSAETHVSSFRSGLQYLSDHPLGTGLGSVGASAIQNNMNGAFFESSFLQYGGEFGLESLACFSAFLFCAFRSVWSLHSEEGNAAAGILIAFSTMMIVLPMHGHFQLACWVWFPIGFAINQASRLRRREDMQHQGYDAGNVKLPC
jgi:hypothetical protein